MTIIDRLLNTRRIRGIITVLIGGVFLFLPARAYAGFTLFKNGPQIHGFLENDYGVKLSNDLTKRDNFNLLEQRLQLKTRMFPTWNQVLSDWNAEIDARGDLTLDEYYNGRTGGEFRDLNLSLSPADWLDIKAGRQIFTWGTGDYLFVNDLFPKDYVSFYIGRDDQYLKKPSDGIKASFYANRLNLDLIVIPKFAPSTFFTGQRVSFYDPFTGGIAGTNSNRVLVKPPENPENTEVASRLYRNFGSYETDIYFYRGHYKLPQGYLNEAAHELFYPRLDVYGASVRGPGAGGILSLEFGYYNSRQDTKGDNRLIANSMNKFLVGYAKDLGNDLSLGLQYLFEQTLDYGDYLRSLMPYDQVRDEYRQVVTLRLTKLFKNQTVRAGMFVFYSPSDQDAYLRPSIGYDLNDNLTLTLGANLAWGRDNYTEFGQMAHDKNIYTRARYSF